MEIVEALEEMLGQWQKIEEYVDSEHPQISEIEREKMIANVFNDSLFKHG
jgi:hypothetical protein